MGLTVTGGTTAGHNGPQEFAASKMLIDCGEQSTGHEFGYPVLAKLYFGMTGRLVLMDGFLCLCGRDALLQSAFSVMSKLETVRKLDRREVGVI